MDPGEPPRGGNPGGQDGVYGVVHFKNTAVGVIPLDGDGNTWLVGQHRFPHGTYSWEIPEGARPQASHPWKPPSVSSRKKSA